MSLLIYVTIKNNHMNWIKTYWKDLLKVVTAVFAIFYVAVFAGVWEDIAETSFWWSFWQVSRIVIALALVVGWVFLWTSQNKRK